MAKHYRGKRRQNPHHPAGNVFDLKTGEPTALKFQGVFERSYPPKAERDHAIREIIAVEEERRRADQWWRLGEYQIFNGLLDEDEGLINDGIAALTSGANLPSPSISCLMDLGWILLSRDLDSFAISYLRKAVELVPNSRDALTLAAIAEIGVGNRANAIKWLAAAVEQPNATENDRSILGELQKGADLKPIRKRQVLQKIGLDDPDLQAHPDVEKAKAAVYILNAAYAREPSDMKVAEALATARYMAGQLERAKPLFDAVVAADPNNASAWTILGLIAKKTSKPDVEIEMYQNAISADPTYSLALVNLAHRLSETDPYAARPLLESALATMAPDDYWRPIALDLMGNSIGILEKDYMLEADFHRQAILARPDYPPYRMNLVMALISAGRPIDARREWQLVKHYKDVIKYPMPLESLVAAFNDEAIHPYDCLQIVDILREHGAPGQRLLLNRAWKRRSQVPYEERLEFFPALATAASHAEDHDLAVNCWREAGALDTTGKMRVNEAVALDFAGKTAEALSLIESLEPNCDRFHTVRGNIRRSAGLTLSAVEAYRKAVEVETPFDLPFSNAFHCIAVLGATDLVEPFIDALAKRWEDSPQKAMLLAHAQLLAGRPSTAAQLASGVLIKDGELKTPEQTYALLMDAEDLSLFTAPSMEFHLILVKALARSRQFPLLRDILSVVSTWPRWMDGDWRIINAEMERLDGRPENVADFLVGMDAQIPAQVTKALAAVELGKLEEAESQIETTFNTPKADGFVHPEGRPDSLAYAIKAHVQRARGDIGQAIESAQEALRRDPNCIIARSVLVDAYADFGSTEAALQIVIDGLKRHRSEPRILRLAINNYVKAGKIEDAERTLAKYRPGLREFGREDVGYQLGELVFAAKLESSIAPKQQVEEARTAWPWLEKLEEPIRSWMIGAHHGLSNIDELRIALAMYAGKTAEKLLVDRVMTPFKKSLRSGEYLTDDYFRDVNSFLAGGRAPSIGGIVRLLITANRPSSWNDSSLLRAFRGFITQANWQGSSKLRDHRFLAKLKTFGEIRNESAHINEPKADAIVDAISIVVCDGKPGPLFEALGLKLS